MIKIPASKPPMLRLLPWLLFALAICAPFGIKGYVTYQLTMLTTFAIAIIGLNLLTGYSGQISLGHGAFCAVGAYTAAILVTKVGVSYPMAILAAGVVSLAVGCLFGWPALRLEPIYLALATFSLAIAMPQVLKLTPLEPWTGGGQGLAVRAPEAPLGMPLTSDQWLYFLTLAIAILLYAVAWRITRGMTGLTLRATREDPIAAAAIGIDMAFYKTATFGISALYAGVAGALGALAVQFVGPDSFPLGLSISLLVGLVVGGVGWLPGCLFGGAFIVLVPNVAEQVSKGLSGAVYGAILLVVIYLMPDGTGGLYRRLTRTLRR